MKTTASLTLRLGLALWLFRLPCQGADALDTWHLRSQPASAASLNAITFANGLFVAVGGAGCAACPDVILTSPDGETWTSRNPGSANALKAVAFGNGTFVAVGGNGNGGVIVTATNAAEWTNLNLNALPDLNAVTWGKDSFVAVGFDWSTLTSAIVSSAEGVAWTHVELPEAITNSGIITCVAFSDGLFVAGTFSPGDILVSTNGHFWTKFTGAGGFHRGVAYGNGTWAVAGGPQIFVGGAAIWMSPDLTNWTPRSVPGGGPNYFPGIAFGNGAFCVPGNWGNISYSRNATNWALRGVGGQQAPLSGIAYGNGTFVAVGPSGAILQSDDVRVPRLTVTEYSKTGFRFTVSGEAGRAFRLQASSEVSASNWSDLLGFTNSTGVTNFEDTTAANFAHRFYRVVSP